MLDTCRFTLRKGEVHILMGEMALVQSTLIKSIAALISRMQGSIKLNGGSPC